MEKTKKGGPPESTKLVEQVGTAATKVLSHEVAPVLDEVQRQARLSAREAALLGAAGAAGFLALQLTLLATVEGLGRRIGRGNAALVLAGGLAAAAGGALWGARRDRPRAPVRAILERVAAVFRAEAL